MVPPFFPQHDFAGDVRQIIWKHIVCDLVASEGIGQLVQFFLGKGIDKFIGLAGLDPSQLPALGISVQGAEALQNNRADMDRRLQMDKIRH